MQVSIWEKETFFRHQDIIIAGSGFVGLWSAYFLKKKHPHLQITIVDRGIIPTGASTRNAGFACFGSLSELISDINTMGTEKMQQLVEMRFRGLEIIQKHFKKTAIDFELSGGYELYEQNTNTEKLEADIDHLNKLLKPITGTKKLYRLDDNNIQNFGFKKTKHLVKNKMEGCLHSGKLLRALLQVVQGMGVTVFNAVEIKNIHEHNQTIELDTPHFKLSCNQLLVCTNAFTKMLVPEIDILPARGQVLLTSAVPGLPFNGCFHADEGFYYFRNLGSRVLLGGARNKAFDEEATTQMQTTDIVQHELEKYLSEVILPGFQNQYTIDQRWAGIMAFGTEKMPIVKEIKPNIFCAVRMSGMGVALAPVVAMDVAKKMTIT